MNRNKIRSSRSKIPKLLVKIDKMANNWEEAQNTDTYLFFKNPKKAIWANLSIGISRGVGFVLGVSIIGVLVSMIIGWLLARFVTIPIIGEYIAIIVQSVQEYLSKLD